MILLYVHWISILLKYFKCYHHIFKSILFIFCNNKINKKITAIINIKTTVIYYILYNYIFYILYIAVFKYIAFHKI